MELLRDIMWGEEGGEEAAKMGEDCRGDSSGVEEVEDEREEPLECSICIMEIVGSSGVKGKEGRRRK